MVFYYAVAADGRLSARHTIGSLIPDKVLVYGLWGKVVRRASEFGGQRNETHFASTTSAQATRCPRTTCAFLVNLNRSQPFGCVSRLVRPTPTVTLIEGTDMVPFLVLVAATLGLRGVGAAGVHALDGWTPCLRGGLSLMFFLTASAHWGK